MSDTVETTPLAPLVKGEDDLKPWEPQPGVWPIVRPENHQRNGTGRKCPQWVKDMVLERIPLVGIQAAMRESSYHPAEVYEWEKQDPDYAKRLAAARKARAHSLAEESVNLLDEGSAEGVEDPKRASAHVNLLGARSKARQWLASKYNPDDYGEKIEHRGTVTQAVVLLPPLDPLPATARMLPESETPPRLQDGVTDAEVVEG